MTGPVQVLVVGYEQPAFTGEVLAEMTRLSDAGLVRLVDVLLVTRAADGTFDTVEVAEAEAKGLPGLPPGTGALAATLLGHSDETGDDRNDAGTAPSTRWTGRSGRWRTRSRWVRRPPWR